MENFDQIFTLIAEHEGIGLNTDILETGLINILCVIAILVYAGKDFLGSLLEERKTNIVKSVQDAEDRLNEANRRLSEAQKQLSQANVVITEIKNETITAKKILLQSDAEQAKKDLATRFSRALATFRSKERQVFLDYLMKQIQDIMQTKQGLDEEENYHEFCRLLGRLKASYQLSELVKTRGDDIIKYVDREITKYDQQCVIPKEFVKAHNDAAEPLK